MPANVLSFLCLYFCFLFCFGFCFFFFFLIFFFNDTATPEIYTLSLHDALPISYEVEYRPLVPTGANGDSKEAQLVITSVELGDYIFKLDLSARPAASERALHFKAALGASHVQTFRFRNYVRSEEHTSELQSRLHLVCRLLLEKTTTNPIPPPPQIRRMRALSPIIVLPECARALLSYR